MATSDTLLKIEEYFRDRLMPVEGEIPVLPGIEMYGDSVPANTAGGDLFEYINFHHRYDLDARIRCARQASQDYLAPHPPGSAAGNEVDDFTEWLRSRPDFRPEMETAHRETRSLEQLRVAENLEQLYQTAGILLVDAQGHGLISAKIASTVHDTFHALMLSGLDRYGTTTPELFENLNLRLAHSRSARNALGRAGDGEQREIATLLYGEVHPSGHFRFVSFGHPPPLLFSLRRHSFCEIDRDTMVRFLPLGLQVPEDHPDRRRYTSLRLRENSAARSDVAELTLMQAGDILFLYTDGVYDGSDVGERHALERVIDANSSRSSKDITTAVLDYALQRDVQLRERGETDLIDDKTVFIIKRSA